MVNRKNDSLHNKELKDLFVLFGSILTGEIEIVRYILGKGINVNRRLQDLSFEPDEEEVKNATISSFDTPLLVAVKRNSDLEIIKLLLENGADITLMDENGKTAVDIASEKKLTNILRLLKAENSE